jgi:hypothetical protein
MNDIVRLQFRILLDAAALFCVTFLWGISMASAQQPALPAMVPTEGGELNPTVEGIDSQERGVLPGLVAPNATVQITAPTLSLSAIRNAIRVTSKSVSVNLRIAPNLPVTVPIEVSVAYISPVQTQRQTKTYNSATGLTILYHEPKGDGKPRPMHLDITVRELIPNGQSFSLSKDFTITPLFDVSMSQLRFTMASFCDRLGKNDITFVWRSPDGRRHEVTFDAGAHEEKVISQFSRGHRQVSTQTNLVEPTVQFFERDVVPDSGFHPIRSSTTPLVPGAAIQLLKFVLNEKATGPPGQPIGSADCQAQIRYRIDRKLMTFDRF